MVCAFGSLRASSGPNTAACFSTSSCGAGRKNDRQERDQVDGAADDAGGRGDLHRRRAGKHAWPGYLGVQHRGHGADHAAAEVRGEAAAGAAQVHREDARQELAQEAELGHGQQAAEEDGGGEDQVILVNEAEIGQRKQDHAGNQEEANQRPARHEQQQHGEQDAPDETAEFLPALDVAATCLERLGCRLLGFAGLVQLPLRRGMAPAPAVRSRRAWPRRLSSLSFAWATGAGDVGQPGDDLQRRQLNRAERRGIAARGQDRRHDGRAPQLGREQLAKAGTLQACLLAFFRFQTPDSGTNGIRSRIAAPGIRPVSRVKRQATFSGICPLGEGQRRQAAGVARRRRSRCRPR